MIETSLWQSDPSRESAYWKSLLYRRISKNWRFFVCSFWNTETPSLAYHLLALFPLVFPLTFDNIPIVIDHWCGNIVAFFSTNDGQMNLVFKPTEHGSLLWYIHSQVYGSVRQISIWNQAQFYLSRITYLYAMFSLCYKEWIVRMAFPFKNEILKSLNKQKEYRLTYEVIVA